MAQVAIPLKIVLFLALYPEPITEEEIEDGMPSIGEILDTANAVFGANYGPENLDNACEALTLLLNGAEVIEKKGSDMYTIDSVA